MVQSNTRSRKGASPEVKVLTPQQFQRDLLELFKLANRTVTQGQLYVMTLLAASDEDGPALQHISDITAVENVARNVGRYVQAAIVSGEAKDLPTQKMVNAIDWLTRPLSDGQRSFIERHSDWMTQAGIAKPSMIAGYQRVYTKHATEFSTGDYQTCSVCLLQREVNEKDTAAAVARADQLVKKFADAVRISI